QPAAAVAPRRARHLRPRPGHRPADEARPPADGPVPRRPLNRGDRTGLGARRPGRRLRGGDAPPAPPPPAPARAHPRAPALPSAPPALRPAGAARRALRPRLRRLLLPDPPRRPLRRPGLGLLRARPAQVRPVAAPPPDPLLHDLDGDLPGGDRRRRRDRPRG